MEQFAHVSTDYLHGSQSCCEQLQAKGLNNRVVMFSRNHRHIEDFAQVRRVRSRSHALAGGATPSRCLLENERTNCDLITMNPCPSIAGQGFAEGHFLYRCHP